MILLLTILLFVFKKYQERIEEFKEFANNVKVLASKSPETTESAHKGSGSSERKQSFVPKEDTTHNSKQTPDSKQKTHPQSTKTEK
jgi:hypothetical protein